MHFLKIILFLVCAKLTIKPSQTQRIGDFDGDNYWPLTTITDGNTFADTVFGQNGTVEGNGVSDDHGVLSITGNGFVSFNGFAKDCVMSPAKCSQGFTVAFWMKLGVISSILGFNDKYHTTLDNWLRPMVPDKSRWVMCYKASQHGWQGTTFRTKCASKHSTLTVVKVRNYIFGGFLSVSLPIRGISGYLTDNKAFLFSLNNPLKAEPFQMKISQPDRAAELSSSFMPRFGTVDLIIQDDANVSTTSSASPGTAYVVPSHIKTNDTSTLLAGSSPFLVDEIEVFASEAIAEEESYILTSGAENPTNNGFTIYKKHSSSVNQSGHLVANVTANSRTWSKSVEFPSKAWQHIAIQWKLDMGLRMLVNGALETSDRSGTASSATTEKSSLLLGKSTDKATPSEQNLQMQGLYMWRDWKKSSVIRTYKNTAFMKLLNESNANFNWSSSKCCSPTSTTGPHYFIRYQKGFYYNLTVNSKTADFNTTMQNLQQFTACWWYMTDQYKSGTYTVFSIKDETISLILSMVLSNTQTTYMQLVVQRIQDRSLSTTPVQIDLPLHRWVHFCALFDTQNLTLIYGLILSRISLTSAVEFSSQIQIRVGQTFDSNNALFGYFSTFNIWGRLLTAQERSILRDQSCPISGDLVRWSMITTLWGSDDRNGTFEWHKDWMYLESSFPRKSHEVARAITSEYIPVYINCLRFTYCMNGQDIGRLNVYLRTNDKNDILIWSLAGDQKSCLNKVYLPLNIQLKSKLIFEGIIGDGYLGDIGVINIYLTMDANCASRIYNGKQYIPLQGIKSRIIGHYKNYTDSLKKWLTSANLNQPYWAPCYNLNTNGWLSSRALHSRCAEKGPVVFIFRYGDSVFGGVFDQSLLAYGLCKEHTVIPSERSFLFNLSSDAGLSTVLPIKSDKFASAFDCTNVDKYFPNFGNELSLDLDTKTLKITYGVTYGSSVGSFVAAFAQNGLVPADIEILVPKDGFSPGKCPIGMKRDELKGSCVCNLSSRVSEQCLSGVLLENFTRDAYDVFTFFSVGDMKSLKRPVWAQVSGSPEMTRGITRNTISLGSSHSITFNDPHNCLANPSQCSAGFTMSIWIRYFAVSSVSGRIFCSGSCQVDTTGIAIIRTQPNDKDTLTITATTENNKCSTVIPGHQGIWTHLVLVITNMGNNANIYINGVTISPISASCIQGHYSVGSVKKVVIENKVDVDYFIVWENVLPSEKIQDLHNLYKGRKHMTLEIEFATTASSSLTNDEETREYKQVVMQIKSAVQQKIIALGATEPIQTDCSLSTAESKINVSLKIVYNKSDYEIAKPFINSFTKGITLGTYSVQNVTSVKLDTVYMESCNITNYKANSSSIMVQWNNNCGSEPSHGLLYGYEIIATDQKTNQSSTVMVTSITTMSTYITNLKYTTNYSVVIKVLTFEGPGNSSAPIIVTTEDRPMNVAPWNVTATSHHYSTLTVIWTFYDLSVWPSIKSYAIQYNSTDVTFNISQAGPADRTYTVTGLKPLTTYTVAVRAYDGHHHGPYSRVIRITTLAAPLNVSPSPRLKAYNSSAMMIQWDGIPNGKYYGLVHGYTVNVSLASGSTVRLLDRISELNVTVTGLLFLTEYYVQVLGINAIGAGPWSAIKNITIPEGVPTAGPTKPEAHLINDTAFDISWSEIAATHTHGIIQGYMVTAVANNSGGLHHRLDLATCNKMASLRGLFPYTDYKVKISGFTKKGDGPVTMFYVSNQLKGPSKPPSSISTGSIHTKSVNITWKAIPVGSYNTDIAGYVVMYGLHNQNQSNISIMVNDSRIMYQVIDGLAPYTKYDIRVAGANIGGVGVFSSPVIVQTAEDVPRIPLSNVSAVEVTTNTSLVQWNPLKSSDVRGVLSGYLVTVIDTLRNENSSYAVCKTQNSLSLSELFPYTSYEVYVKPFTGGGMGNSTKLTFQTAESAPDAPPEIVTSKNSSSTGILLVWNPPPITNINGKLRGYVLIWFETLAVNPEIFNKTITLQAESPRRKRRDVDSASSSQTIELTGLKKYTMYTIRIQAFTVQNGVFMQINTTTAQDVPSVPPSNVIAYNLSSTALSVSWKSIPEEFVHGILLGYHVFYQRSDQPSLLPLVKTVDHTILNVIIGNLSKYVRYDISVAGFTKIGTGNVSRIVNASTDQDVPDEAPLNVHGKPLSTSEIAYTWQPIKQEKRNGIITGYTLTLRNVDGSVKKSFSSNASTVRLTVNGLESWTNYTADISGMTIKGSGPPSPQVLVATLEEVPDPPLNISAVALSSTSINVTWSARNTTFLRGILRKYRIIYTSKGSVFPTTTRNVTTSAENLNVVLTDLYKYTEYEIAITAISIADGNRSLPVVARTDSDVPSAGPAGLALLESSPYSFTIKFGEVPPEHRNGIIGPTYKVVVTRKGTSSPIAEKPFERSGNLAVVDNLIPFVNYTLFFFASTDKGWGKSSELTVQTAESVPHAEPNTSSTVRFSIDSIPLNWQPVTKEEANGIVLGYKITSQLVSLGEEPLEEEPIKEIRVQGTSFTLTNLQMYGRYKIGISAYTVKGDGPEMIQYGETCRCRQNLYANWREYEPYVNVSNITRAPGGILPQVIKEMTRECCQQCSHNYSVVDFFTNADGTSAIKVSEDELKSNLSENIDFTFPIYGHMDQDKYHGGFGYSALIESPGIVLVVNTDFQFDYENLEGPSRTTINSILRTLVYIAVTLAIAYLAGFVMWILDRDDNPEFFPPSYIKGTYEGFWWAFITMTTLGYGDRYPITVKGKMFGIFWMLMGIVLYGMLLSFLSSALTTKTITFNGDLSTRQIAAIHNSPEYHLGKRLNFQINKDVHPESFQELYDALIQRKVYGALIDGYAIGHQKHLFKHPHLKFSKMFNDKPAYGIVLGGTSSRLRKCFLRYIQDKRAEIFRRIAEIALIFEIEDEDGPLIMQFSTNLIKAGTTVFTNTVVALVICLAILVLFASIYECVNRRRARVAKSLSKYEQDIQRMRKFVQIFHDRINKTGEKLRVKHELEIHQYLEHKKKTR